MIFTWTMGQTKWEGARWSFLEVNSCLLSMQIVLNGLRTLQISDTRSGRSSQVFSQHLNAKYASCVVWWSGHSPAEKSNTVLRFSFSNAHFISLTSPESGLPVRSCNSMIPNEYTSDSGVNLPVTRHSGSTYAKRLCELLHTTVPVSAESILCWTKEGIPRSPSLATKLASRRTLLGFKFPWIIQGLLEWRNIRAEHMSAAMDIRICHGSGVLSLQARWLSRLPLFRYSYTSDLDSAQLPISVNRFGCRTLLKTSTWNSKQ